jgi:hypothetical protein
MNRRPWGIVILAALQLTAPLVSLCFSALAWQTTPEAVARFIISKGTYAQWFDFFVVPIIAAFAVYSFRVWSYFLFFAICAWTIGENTATFLAYQDEGMRIGWVLAAQVLNLIAVSYFLFPGVRATYFDRRVRWWETRPRYKVSADGAVSTAGGEETCEILDVSMGGIFLRSLGERTFALGDVANVKFELEGVAVEASAKVVHQGRILRQSYGFQFVERDGAKLQAIARLVKILDLKGYVTDRRLSPWQEDFKNWLKDAVHTAGRSIVPVIPASPREKSPAGSDDDQGKAA